MKKLLLLSTLACALFSGCIQTPEPDVPKRIALVYNVENIGTDITANEDTVNVDVIKLLADKINFRLIDDRTIQTEADALVMTYRSLFEGEDETVFSASIGLDDFRGFKGLTLFIDTPNEGDNILDNDFFADPDNFSFIITGSINNRDFTYRSSPVFEKDFPFASNVELSNENETLFVKLTYDLSEVLLDSENNKVLDPTNPDNQAIIDSLLQESLNIEVTAINAI